MGAIPNKLIEGSQKFNDKDELIYEEWETPFGTLKIDYIKKISTMDKSTEKK
jgi:hypothetical protein